MAVEVHRCVNLREYQQESDRSLCASASFSQVIGKVLHTHKNCSKLLLETENLICISKERSRNLKPGWSQWQEEEMTSFRIF